MNVKKPSWLHSLPGMSGHPRRQVVDDERADRINTTDLVPPATIVYEEALAAVDAELAKGLIVSRTPWVDK
jgi:hypothetical protein